MHRSHATIPHHVEWLRITQIALALTPNSRMVDARVLTDDMTQLESVGQSTELRFASTVFTQREAEYQHRQDALLGFLERDATEHRIDR